MSSGICIFSLTGSLFISTLFSTESSDWSKSSNSAIKIIFLFSISTSWTTKSSIFWSISNCFLIFHLAFLGYLLREIIPSISSSNSIIIPLSRILITLPEYLSPVLYFSLKVSQGFSSTCLIPRDNLLFSISNSNILTSISWYEFFKFT